MLTRMSLGLILFSVFMGSQSRVHGGDEIKPYKDVLDKMVASLKEMSATLEKVEKEEDVPALKPQLAKAVDAFVKARRESETIPLPDKKQRDKLVDMYRERLAKYFLNLRAHVGRIQNLSGNAKEILVELKRLYPEKNKKSDTIKKQTP